MLVNHKDYFMRQVKTIVIALSLLLSANIFAKSPSLPTDYKLVGKASLSFWWWDIYHSMLYTESGSYQTNENSLLLKLVYQRSISKQQLLDETQSQWKRFKIDVQQQKNWLQQLDAIWSDVKKNDSIAVYLDSQKQSHFYFNEKFVGTIKDAEFAKAFMDIWLSEEGEYPKLSRKLTGKKP